MAKRAVFLDRDGALNVEKGYMHNVDDLELIPGVAQSVRRLNDAGLFCCLVSNQAGPARGYYPLDHVEALNARLVKLLAVEGNAHLDAVHYCPYLSPPEGAVNSDYAIWGTWRKPNTGMLVAAAWKYDLDIRHSFMVGDKATDVDLAHNAGAKGILVQTGYGQAVLSGDHQHVTHPDYTARDLNDGVDWILAQIS